jgi:hypothetical protein
MRARHAVLSFVVLATAAFGAAGCQTQEVDTCLPGCTATDHARFVDCVANGAGSCRAGNRRCCAEAAQCLGTLEDQTVVTTASCQQIVEEVCWPPCDDMAEILYEGCLSSGGSTCAAGDEECCALSVDCLGELGPEGDVIVYADGCCVDDLDCDLDEVCDTETWTCVVGVSGPGCGDELVEAPEECDDGDTITNECPYGAMSCEVCTADCTLGPGTPSFCGDGRVDEAAGEDCEPPASAVCDPMCFAVGSSSCTDGSQNGAETDIDCGGPCPPCLPGDHCVTPMDCGVTRPECMGIPVCDPELAVCDEILCDDLEACTVGTCLATGCSQAPLDEDMDGHGPRDLGCGGDCDDFSARHTPDLTIDGCGDGDNDCDDIVDEDC